MSTPQKFEFSEWFGDEDVPEASLDVFLATGMVGEIQALQRRIEEGDRVRDVEASLADDQSDDEEALAALLQEFADSRVTVYIKGLTHNERRAIRKAHDASHQPDEDFPERCLASSIVALKKANGTREDVSMSLSAVQKLHKKVGDGQFAQLFQTYQQATSGIPHVDADFLLKRSGQANTQES